MEVKWEKLAIGKTILRTGNNHLNNNPTRFEPVHYDFISLKRNQIKIIIYDKDHNLNINLNTHANVGFCHCFCFKY